MKKAKLKSKRERAAVEVGKMLQEDPVFRIFNADDRAENFLKALNPHVSLTLRAVLESSIHVEVGKMLQEDPVFRENFLKALNPHVSLILRAVLESSIQKQKLAGTDSKASPDSIKGDSSAK